MWGKQVAAFNDKARGLLGGEGRGVVFPEYGEIYWDEDEGAFLHLSEDLDGLYDQTLDLVRSFLEESGREFDDLELNEIVRYQRMRIPTRTMPETTSSTFSFNIPEYFEKLFGPDPIPLTKQAQVLDLEPVDFENDNKRYARETILWGRKSDLILVNATLREAE